jgi:hypothetical protein
VSLLCARRLIPVDRHQHTILAGPDVNTTTILDLITARDGAASTAADELREQIGALSAELATVEAELDDLQVTRQTLMNSPTAS